MLNAQTEKLIRQYASGAVTWHALREQGFADYVQVLGALGEIGLRPPYASPTGVNVESRRRGRDLLREALKDKRRS